LKKAVISDMVPCSLIDVYRYFRGVYCLHHQVDDGGSTHHLNVVYFYEATRRHTPQGWHLQPEPEISECSHWLHEGGVSAFGLWNMWSGTSDRVTYQKFAGSDGTDWKEQEGREGDKVNCLLLHSSFSGPYGQRSKTVEAVILIVQGTRDFSLDKDTIPFITPSPLHAGCAHA
jgi:hypothetical protein